MLTSPLHEMPLATTDIISGAQHYQVYNLLDGCVFSQTSPPSTEIFTLDAYAQDSQHDANFNPHMLNDEATSTC